jgi:hypothetical protein
VSDRDETTTHYTAPRTVRFKVVFFIDTNATEKDVYLAITPGLASPYNGGAVATYSGTFAGTSLQSVTGSLVIPPDSLLNAQWPSRPNATTATTMVSVQPFYLWLGWRIYGASVSDSRFEGISAWEYRG